LTFQLVIRNIVLLNKFGLTQLTHF